MKVPEKKLKTGFRMPVFGFGTWRLGGGEQRDLNNDDQADINAIRAAIDLGITHIDTAEIYAQGRAEELVAEGIKNYGRKNLFITSKAQFNHLAYDKVIKSCKQSLRRLRLDYLDLYLAHRYNPDVDLRQTIAAFDELVKLGLVKNIGVSNFNLAHLKQAQAYSKNKIVCDQVHYNLMFREPEVSGLLEYCQTNDVFLVAWRPVGKGNLLVDLPPVLSELCQKYNKTPAQVAINWLVAQPNVLTLFKAGNVAHLRENFGAIGWEMSRQDIERLRKEYPGQKYISDVVALG
jgi:diketogulonate reductase-like aldo/keto reductase